MKKSQKYISVLLTLIILFSSAPYHVLAENSGQNTAIFKGEGYTIEFRVDNQWENQYQGAFVFTNTGMEAMENWGFQCSYEDEIINIWNAVVQSHEGSAYIIKNAGWNQDILPGQSVSAGFIASFKSDVHKPSGYITTQNENQISDERYKVEFIVNSDWESGYTGNVTIYNLSSATIEDWKLAFDLNREIVQIWSAEILDQDGGHYTVQNAGYSTDIKPGQSVNFGFNGAGGKEPPKLTNPILIEQGGNSGSPAVPSAAPDTDTDGDGLTDSQEEEIGTDKQLADTDGDGLPDGYEVLTLGIDPLSKDSDADGIADNNKDMDQDGLTDFEEYELGTLPFYGDTDNDGIGDKEETAKHKTDPLVLDTDGDGMSDSDELALGLNPLSKYTEKGILDGSVVKKQIVNGEDLEYFNGNSPYELSIEVTASGYAESAAKIRESYNTAMLSDNTSVLGSVFHFSYEGELEDASFSFEIPEEGMEKKSRMYPEEKGFEGIQRFQVFCYNEEAGIFYPVSTQYDMEKNTLKASGLSEGDYCILDMDRWFYNLGFELPEEIEAAVQKQEKMQAKLQKMAAASVQPSVTLVNKQIDITFLIDTSASMVEKIDSCKEYIDELITNLYNDNITARVSVFSFDDYSNEIKMYELASGGIWGSTPLEAEELISQVTTTDGDRENHMDALEKLLKLDFRENAARFAIMLTDEPLNHSDDHSSYTSLMIAEKLNEKNIITSFACPEDDIKSFRQIFEETDGIQTSISLDFMLYFELFIKTVMKDMKTYSAVIPANLAVVSLSSVPVKGSSVDTDGDKITDSSEIDWFLIREKNGVMILPTLNEYLVYNSIKDFESFRRLSKEKAAILHSIVVLPIFSNPASKDGDGDGYLDPDDKKPLHSDVIITKLKEDKFVSVDDNGKINYGGDQDWFGYNNPIGVNGGCGTVAGANIAAYLAKHFINMDQLYAYNDEKITRTDFLKHMDEMYQYITPKSLFGKALGVWPLSHFTDGFVKFAKSRGVSLRPHLVNDKMNKENVTEYIKSGLEQNNPSALLIAWNPKLKSIMIYDSADKAEGAYNFNVHWVTVTEIKEDYVTGKNTMKVSSWGSYAYIDVDDFVNDERIYEAVIYFKEK